MLEIDRLLIVSNGKVIFMNTSSSEIETQSQGSEEINYDFKKILIAVDYLPFTEEIFLHGVKMARQYQSQLMLFHCVPGDMPGIPELMTTTSIGVYGGVYSRDLIMLSEKLIEEAKAQMNVWLDSLAQKAIAQGIPTEFEYRIGQPGQQICRKAQDWGANLIVMGRRGHKGLSEFLLGSASNYVLHHANCSVLIVQH
jgi:nucleotide-binding universal stress UspA family protein